MPYIYTLLNCLICAWYGSPFVSIDNILITTVNSIGAIFQLVYLFLFISYAERERKVLNRFKTSVWTLIWFDLIFVDWLVNISPICGIIVVQDDGFASWGVCCICGFSFHELKPLRLQFKAKVHRVFELRFSHFDVCLATIYNRTLLNFYGSLVAFHVISWILHWHQWLCRDWLLGQKAWNTCPFTSRCRPSWWVRLSLHTGCLTGMHSFM